MEIRVREVYSHNLMYEFDLITGSLVWFPYVSMDTEYPGTVFHPEGVPAHLCSTLPPASFYATMKRNVDAMKLIQVGLTFSDSNGNLPTLGTSFRFVWEFNFREFDHEVDLQNPDSISLLKRRGIDFSRNKRIGIDSRMFAALFKRSALGPRLIRGDVMWVTFYGPYDFGFLIKILTGNKKLPEDVDGFLSMVKAYFGPKVYDLKTMIGLFGLHGGLDRVAKILNLERMGTGKGRHQGAGSGSLLTMQVYLGLKNRFCDDQKIKSEVCQLNHAIYGLSSVT